MYVKKGPRKGKDLTGQRFGNLVAVAPHNGYTSWKYLCDCGNYVTMRRQQVEKSPFASCGCVNNKSHSKLYKLLDGSFESFYWHGFLIGDGYFGNNVQRLSLTLSRKDEYHLEKFKEFIECGAITRGISKGYGSTTEYSRLSVMDTENLPKLAEMYGITGAKTKNPPNIDILDGENLICFIIGFIDADGCISYQSGRTDCTMSIKKHQTWVGVLSKMFSKTATINKEGYAFIDISDNEILREFKRVAVNNRLPYMPRKWNLVDENRVSRYVISKARKEKVKRMWLDGFKIKDIAKTVGVSAGRVSAIMKEIGLR